jgi:hypothetical protein
MSIKYLAAVPFLVLGLSVYGCSSDNTAGGKGGSGGSSSGGKGGGSAGKGGSGGGTAGSGGGTAGAGGGTAGAGGGTAGAGGATAGSGGRGGSGGGTAGAGGGTAGAGGATAGAGGGTAGAGGGTAGAGGGTAGAGGATGGSGGGGGGTGGAAMSTLEEVKAMCGTTVTVSSGTFTAEDFCTIYLSVCANDLATGYTNRGMCMNSFATVSATNAQCRSYHVCNANAATTAANVTLHCGHATGIGLCN